MAAIHAMKGPRKILELDPNNIIAINNLAERINRTDCQPQRKSPGQWDYAAQANS